MSEVKPFSIIVDRVNEVVTIQGIRYAFEWFDHLGLGPIGTQLVIVHRADGVVTLAAISPPGGDQ